MSSVRTIRVLAFIVASILSSVLLVLAEPLIDNIVVLQVGSTSQLEVTYDLSNCDSAIITMEVEIDSETLPDNLVTRVAGAVNRVVSADSDLLYGMSGQSWVRYHRRPSGLNSPPGSLPILRFTV